MKKHIKNTILLAILAITFSSCESTLDINESPTAATVDVVTPDLLLAGAITSPRARWENNVNELGAIMTNQWAGDINNVTGGYQDEFRLNFTQNYPVGTVIWRDIYRGMGTYQAILNHEDPSYGNHKAIARILKSYYFQTLVDLWGNIPYSQALQFGENFTPAYDVDQSIYRGLIIDLDAALAAISTSDDFLPVGTEDIVYGGDMSSWARLANTIKLRVLLRQADMGGETATYLNEQFATLSQNFITSDALINPPYANAVGQQNPFFANFGQDDQGVDTFDNDFVVPSDYMAEFLKGNATENGVSTGVLDPRLTALFVPVPVGPDAGQVVGVIQGATNEAAPPQLSEIGPGLLKGSEQPGYLFSAAESYFLQAEAAHRGWISGSAMTYFQNGITASFNALDIPASAAGYIASSDPVNLIGWTGSSNKIEAIMTQKWIALNGINAIESWIDFTRTGYPAVPLPIIAEQPNRPNRLLYPASEFATNSANVPNQPASEAFSTKIFWDVN